jgi:hypothetical protein
MGNSFSSYFYNEEFKTKSLTLFDSSTRIFVVDKNRDFWIGSLEKRLNLNISENAAFCEVRY